MRLALLLLLAAGVTPAPSQSPASRPSAASRPSVAALDRVVSIGASLSNGFGNGFPPARLLQQIITGKHQPVAQETSDVFFLNPEQVGDKQIAGALKKKATLVLGFDYLFWFGYGHMRGTSRARVAGKFVRDESALEVGQRVALLERGLALLDKLDLPLVIGDLPDMWGADEAMLSPVQIPSANTLERLNARIRAWAAARGNVLVLPVSQWVALMRDGKLTLPDGAKADLASKNLLQGDRLHPTRLGVIAVMSHLVVELRRWLGKGADQALRFDTQAAIEEYGDEK